MCNVESQNIYVTRFTGTFTPPVSTLTARAAKGEMIYNDVIEGYFDDDKHAEEIRDICSIKCPECARKGTGSQEAFRSIQALKRHMNAAHGLSFCDICLEASPYISARERNSFPFPPRARGQDVRRPGQ